MTGKHSQALLLLLLPKGGIRSVSKRRCGELRSDCVQDDSPSCCEPSSLSSRPPCGCYSDMRRRRRRRRRRLLLPPVYLTASHSTRQVFALHQITGPVQTLMDCDQSVFLLKNTFKPRVCVWMLNK